MDSKTGKENETLVELTSLGNDKYLPTRIQERRHVVSRFSGVCLEYVTLTTFSDYVINGKAVPTGRD